MSIALCIGDNCIDRYLPPLNKHFIGGNALNTAVHMKLAGCDVSYMGAVGEDEDGKAILDVLSNKGIDVSHCQIYPTNTAFTKVQLAEDGNRYFLDEDRGATADLHIDQEALDYIHKFKLVHNTWLGGTEDSLKAFHNLSGNKISMDYGERYSEDFVDKTIQYIDIAFFSTNPGEHISAETLAKSIFSRGPKLVVVTMGSEGSLVYDGNFTFQPAQKVDVLDTLGAGDTFIATFLAHWVMGKSVAQSMELATKAAAHTCTIFGAWDGSQLP